MKIHAANEDYIKTTKLSDVAKAYEAERNRLVMEQIAIMQQEINSEMLFKLLIDKGIKKKSSVKWPKLAPHKLQSSDTEEMSILRFC